MSAEQDTSTDVSDPAAAGTSGGAPTMATEAVAPSEVIDQAAAKQTASDASEPSAASPNASDAVAAVERAEEAARAVEQSSAEVSDAAEVPTDVQSPLDAALEQAKEMRQEVDHAIGANAGSESVAPTAAASRDESEPTSQAIDDEPPTESAAISSEPTVENGAVTSTASGNATAVDLEDVDQSGDNATASGEVAPSAAAESAPSNTDVDSSPAAEARSQPEPVAASETIPESTPETSDDEAGAAEPSEAAWSTPAKSETPNVAAAQPTAAPAFPSAPPQPEAVSSTPQPSPAVPPKASKESDEFGEFSDGKDIIGAASPAAPEPTNVAELDAALAKQAANELAEDAADLSVSAPAPNTAKHAPASTTPKATSKPVAASTHSAEKSKSGSGTQPNHKVEVETEPESSKPGKVSLLKRINFAALTPTAIRAVSLGNKALMPMAIKYAALKPEVRKGATLLAIGTALQASAMWGYLLFIRSADETTELASAAATGPVKPVDLKAGAHASGGSDEHESSGDHNKSHSSDSTLHEEKHESAESHGASKTPPAESHSSGHH